MPTTLNNQANITYDYVGSAETESAESNSVVTTLLDEYSAIATKNTINNNFRPGENVAYTIRLENNGRGDLYNVQVADNLGSTTSSKPLTFLSAILYINNVQTPITPVITEDNSVSFQLPSPFSSGDVAIILYTAAVKKDIAPNITSITNTATITANGGSVSGPIITVNPSPIATINIANFAQLCISKQSDKETIASGETLTYTFTINNSGNEQANNVVLTDTLPQNFTISQVNSIINGTTRIYQPNEYDLDSTNTITLPNSSVSPITVPAATSSGPGTVIVQISGTVTV